MKPGSIKLFDVLFPLAALLVLVSAVLSFGNLEERALIDFGGEGGGAALDADEQRQRAERNDPEGEHLHYWLPALRALSARQCLSLHFTFGQDDPLPDYPAAMLPLPAADLKLA